MAGGLIGSKARGRRRRGGGRHAPMSEINVTPFVDVMLVLLIVFMVAAPLLTVGVPIDLPETKAKAMEDETQPLTVSIKANGEIFLQELPVDLESVVARIEAIAENGYDERIYVRGDASADYGQIAKVMALINAAGFKRIGLVTDSEQ